MLYDSVKDTVKVCAVCFYAVAHKEYSKASKEDIAYFKRGRERISDCGLMLLHQKSSTSFEGFSMVPCECCGNAKPDCRYSLAVVPFH